MSNSRRALGPRLKLTLIRSLQSLIEVRRGKPPSGAEGASILLVLLVVLILIVGTATLASRSFQGLIGSVFLGQSREAAAAAEGGATWFIAQMNKPVNRPLLVNRGTVNTATAETPGVAFAAGNIGPSLCTPVSGPGPNINAGLNALDPDPSTAAFEEWYVQADGTVTATQPAGGNYRSFRLLGVRQPSWQGNKAVTPNQFGLWIIKDRDFTDLSASGTQPLYLQVEGSSFRNGARVASMTLEQEYEIVPKCCGRSFGREHGNDDYKEVLGSELGVCVPDTKDFFSFGLVAGAGPGAGDYNIVGNPTFETPEGDAVNPLVCLNDVTTDPPTQCTSNQPGLTQNIDLEIPLPDHYCTGSNVAPALTEAQCKTSYPPLDVDDMITATGQDLVTKFTSKGSTTYEFNVTTATTLPPNCTERTSNSVETIHCNMQALPNDDVTFRTSVNQRIALYFPENGDISQAGGNKILQNEACPANSITDCKVPADFEDYPITTLGIYGCITPGCSQELKLAGTPDSLYLFIHAPYAELDLRGTANFIGAAWVKDVKANGTTDFIIPGSGIGEILFPPGKNPLFFDWTARATNRFRWIGN